MPPIINSHNTGKVTEATKDVFVECSGFDFEVLKKCLNIIVCVLADMEGSIYQMELKGAPEKISPDFTNEKMKISIENTNKLLGISLDEKQITNLLEKMGPNYDSKTKEVEIAPWRIDILHEVDLIEDIGIAYGYENFIPEIPKISTIGQEDSKEIIKRKISEILSGLGLLEISNYHLTNKKDQFTKMGVPEKQEKNFIELEESKTDFNILRKDLTHYALKILSENVDSEYPQKIFELGKIFELNHEKITEKENICIALTPGNFTDLKKVIEYLFRMLGLKLEFKESENNSNTHFIDGRVAKLILNTREIGILGEIHPRTLKNWKIKMPVALLELSLEDVFERLK